MKRKEYRVDGGCGGETEHTVISTLLSVSLCPWNMTTLLTVFSASCPVCTLHTAITHMI